MFQKAGKLETRRLKCQFLDQGVGEGCMWTGLERDAIDFSGSSFFVKEIRQLSFGDCFETSLIII
ncbi:hypothetical protein [Lentibacillus sp. Marseille-P4043]|uniref:hypothetical protein n=1 Tax=Lentibacillus sp. Marseille-P4043 TaxID=2040293 RepID=UPI00131A4B23|nr:hypothetical protein [Lentibacillus sp. Marseille-P4043]